MTSLKTILERHRIALAAGAGVLVLLVIYFMSAEPAHSQKNFKDQVQTVTVAKAVAKAMPVEIGAIGHIEAIASVAIKPRVDGEIAQVAVKDGQDVKAGDLLIALDDREARAALEQAEANLERDQAQLAFAKHEEVRFANLAKSKAASVEQEEQAKANAGALQGTVDADQAEVDADKVQLSYTQITAPIDGRIGTINLKTGNVVQTADTTPLTTIRQIAPIYVSFSIPERELPSLQQAMADGPVKVSVSTQGSSAISDTGEVAYVDNAIDTSSETVLVYATLPNANHQLWPGQFVNALATLRVEPGAITVPSTAVQPGQDGSYVFVVEPNMTVAMRPVTVDRIVGLETVISKGLKAGEEVVTSGQLRLTPGARIAIEKAGAGKGAGT